MNRLEVKEKTVPQVNIVYAFPKMPPAMALTYNLNTTHDWYHNQRPQSDYAS